MPHIILEYSDNLAPFDAHETLLGLNRTAVEVGHFEESDIKARAYMATRYVVGTHDVPRGYASLRFFTRLSDPVKKKELSEALLETLMAFIPPMSGLDTQYAVDIIPIDAASYTKSRRTI